jgi:hypothetical protein
MLTMLTMVTRRILLLLLLCKVKHPSKEHLLTLSPTERWAYLHHHHPHCPTHHLRVDSVVVVVVPTPILLQEHLAVVVVEVASDAIAGER